MMFKCFRRDDAADPQTFLDAAAAILADYPDDVIVEVTDPRTGIPSRQKWPPQPHEVKTACEQIEAPRRRQIEREESIRKQLEERAEFEAMTAPKQTFEEYKVEMAARGFGTDGKKPPVISEMVAEMKKRFNLTDEQWDTLPNLPANHEDEWAELQRNHSGR